MNIRDIRVIWHPSVIEDQVFDDIGEVSLTLTNGRKGVVRHHQKDGRDCVFVRIEDAEGKTTMTDRTAWPFGTVHQKQIKEWIHTLIDEDDGLVERQIKALAKWLYDTETTAEWEEEHGDFERDAAPVEQKYYIECAETILDVINKVE